MLNKLIPIITFVLGSFLTLIIFRWKNFIDWKKDARFHNNVLNILKRDLEHLIKDFEYITQDEDTKSISIEIINDAGIKNIYYGREILTTCFFSEKVIVHLIDIVRGIDNITNNLKNESSMGHEIEQFYYLKFKDILKICKELFELLNSEYIELNFKNFRKWNY